MLRAVDAGFFTFSAVAALWFAYILVRDGVQPGWTVLLIVVFWVFLAYLALPRLHGVLTAVYLPNYFIGRARTSDGLLSDPINVAFRGREAQLHRAMHGAGWTRADDRTVGSSLAIIASVVSRRSYPAAPVTPLHLFGRPQDFAYQREVEGSPSQRHHIRFWHCPQGWPLPGGFHVDWLAAGSYDRSVGLSTFTLQVTHRIAPDIDSERDYVVASVTDTSSVVRAEWIPQFSTGYHTRNGGGDLIETDGALPILDVRALTSAETASAAGHEREGRPVQTLLAGAIALARAAVYAVMAGAAVLAPTRSWFVSGTGTLADGGSEAAVYATISVVAAVVDAVLALAVLSGRNWARLALMGACAATVLLGVGVWLDDAGAQFRLADLPPVGGSILILLALSSRPARLYATGSARRRGGVEP